MSRSLFSPYCVIVVLAGCGGDVEHPPPDATVDAVAGDAGDASVADAADEPISYDIVDGGGDSPDCYSDGDIVQACCNGQYCQGFCVALADGGIGCSCFGIDDGCAGMQDAVCCATNRGCVYRDYCGTPQH